MLKQAVAVLQAMLLACAAWPLPAPAQFLTTAPCSSMNTQKAIVGARCATSSGNEFRRYLNPASGAMGWLDLGEGGKVWYDEVKVNSAQPEAARFCAAHPGQNAPSLEDFARAGARGLKDVLRVTIGTVHNPLVWSAQMDETSHGERAVGYALDTDDFHAAKISEPFDNAVIICVGSVAALR